MERKYSLISTYEVPMNYHLIKTYKDGGQAEFPGSFSPGSLSQGASLKGAFLTICRLPGFWPRKYINLADLYIFLYILIYLYVHLHIFCMFLSIFLVFFSYKFDNQ